MPPKFPADENFNVKIIAGLLRREPSIDFLTARAARIVGLTDQEVLVTAAREGRLLISHDRETMPAHFSRFITETISPGLRIVSQSMAMREAIDEIPLVWTTSEADECHNRIGFLPV